MKILISMISCKPIAVQKWFDVNQKVISTESDINKSVLVLWNNIESIPEIDPHGITYIPRMIDPVKTPDGKFHFNESRFKFYDEFDYDYLHLIDDDAYYVVDLDLIYGHLTTEGFVQVTGKSYRSEVNTDTDHFIKNFDVKFKKKDYLSNSLRVTCGGHIISRKFVFDHYDEFVSFNGFNEDTWRCFIAIKHNGCYQTSRYCSLSTYDSSNYATDMRVDCLEDWVALGCNVLINQFNSAIPVTDTTGLIEVLPHVFISKMSTKPSMIRKYYKRHPELKKLRMDYEGY